MRRGLKIFLVFSLLFVVFSVQASAQTYDFTTCGAEGAYGPNPGDCNYDNFSVDIVGDGIQEWKVPDDGEYRIKIAGAEGGEYSSSDGGNGAVIKGIFELNGGEELNILVGQRGEDGDSDGAGGGGGTFVAKGSTYANSDPIIVAGGGAGRINSYDLAKANTGTCGNDGQNPDSGYGNGGCNGEGGQPSASSNPTGGGGGFVTNGGCGDCWGEDPGVAFQNGGRGGGPQSHADRDRPLFFGGFGGGNVGWYAGSGGQAGGGYSGGGGGDHGDGDGGGGGSFIRADAENPATSDGNWDTTGTEPHDIYEGKVGDLNEWNTGHGKVVIEKIDGNVDFCNFRGPVNECVMNQTNELSNQKYNVSSIFEARSNAVFEAFNGRATLNLTNSTSISGLWRGSIRIEAERPRIQSGAKFRPEGERIVIGK